MDYDSLRGAVLLDVSTGRRLTKVQSQTGAMDDKNRTVE